MARIPRPGFTLAPHLVGRDDPTGARRGQGVLLTFDSETFENTVSFRGTTYVNMPLLTVTNAVDYEGGDIVVVEGWAPEGRLGSWYIVGRVIIPPVQTSEN